MIVLRGKARWSLILFALFVMIASGMASTLMIQRLDMGIADMRRQVAEDDVLIRSLWQGVLQDENKTHLMVMYALLSDGDERADAKALYAAYADFLKLNVGQEVSLKALPSVLRARESKTFDKINRIDDTYLQKQSREAEIGILSYRKSLIVNIALFLQLFSLAIITIVRDLK